MFKVIILSLTLLLAACQTQVAPDEHYTNRDTISHPSWPEPLKARAFSNHVFVVDGVLYVGKTYEDNLEYEMYMEDIYKYTQDLTSIACFYRTELKEPRCEDETPTVNTEIKSPTAP